MTFRRHPHRTSRREPADAVSIRRALSSDAAAVARLARLDSRPVPPGQLLVAEVDGEIVAALPVAGAPAIADPFRPTAGILALLALRAGQLRALEHRAPARPEVSAQRVGAAPAWGRR